MLTPLLNDLNMEGHRRADGIDIVCQKHALTVSPVERRNVAQFDGLNQVHSYVVEN